MRRSILTTVALMLLTTAVAAGPLEDAIAADTRGDHATAVQLFRPLANQGNAYAQFRLGAKYGFGHGVPQDYVEAVKWFRLAADQGNAGAQIKLGLMYQLGQGAPQDYVLAHMWFNLSAAQGDQFSAAERDDIAKLMTPTQIAEAQKLAREWQPKRP
jgi:TPR repeat protein